MRAVSRPVQRLARVFPPQRNIRGVSGASAVATPSRQRQRSVPTKGIGRICITCKDKPGLIAAITEFMHSHGANVVQLDQYTSPTTGNFFFRAEFDLASLESHPLNLEKAFAELAPQFGMEHKFTYPSRPPKVAILCSKTDHCLRELLWKKANGDLPMRVPLVVSNHDSLRGYAEEAGAAFHRISVTKDNKLEAEAALLKLLRDNRIDLVVLARYMQILSADFTEAFGSSRIINIHHSFLPAFVGANPYGQAHKRGVKLIGATAHFVTSDLDEGPIIGQDVAHISHSETGKQLVAIGKEVERKVLSKAVKQWCEDRLFIDGDNRTVVFT